jgi:hypothetical protein
MICRRCVKLGHMLVVFIWIHQGDDDLEDGWRLVATHIVGI